MRSSQRKFVLGAGVCVYVAAGHLAAQTVAFIRQDTAAPPAPRDVFVADFNGDGKADLALNNVVLLGNGDGTFGPPLKFAADTEIRDRGVRVIAVADFNGDRRPDLALSDGSILLGNGDGTFLVTGQLPEGTQIRAVADFNGDGKPDIVATNPGISKISFFVFLGRGDGSFESPVEYMVGRCPCFSFLTADFNGDGNPDLAIGTTGSAINSVSVLLGYGDGTFGDPIVSPVVPEVAVPVAAGDLNGDGKPDLVLDNGYLDHILVVFGKGDGTFTVPYVFAAGNAAAPVVIGDFNGDGIPDLAVGQWINISTDDPSDYVSVLLGKGDGKFEPELRFSVGDMPGYLAIGDFNGDGKLDVVASNWSSNTVTVLLNNGGGSPQVSSVLSPK